MTTASEDFKMSIEEAETLLDGVEILSNEIPYDMEIDKKMNIVTYQLSFIIKLLNEKLAITKQEKQ